MGKPRLAAGAIGLSSESAHGLRNHWFTLLIEKELVFTTASIYFTSWAIEPGSLVIPVLTDLHREIGHLGQVNTKTQKNNYSYGLSYMNRGSNSAAYALPAHALKRLINGFVRFYDL
ncbi:hypothetical protein AAHC03_026295 [Spirometra sp. Aus1]